MTSPFARSLAAPLVVLLVGVAACSSPEEKARAHTARADAYVAKQQFSEAVIEYRNALKARPESADAHYKLATAYMKAGEPVKAYSSFARAADLDPSNVDAQVQAGQLLLAAGEFERARTRAELALKADDSSVPAHILMGNALAGLNDTKRAVQEIEQAIALDPSHAPAWTALGAARFIGGGREAAGEAFKKAVALAPASLEARLALANFHWAMGDTRSTEAILTDALALGGKNASVHRSLALLYLTTRRPKEAEAHFRALADADPTARVALADYYVGMNRRDEAMALLREVERGESKPDALASRLRIASLEYDAGRKAEAHAILDALVAEKPRNADARVAKARALLADGKPEEALHHANEAVKAESASLAAQYTVGVAAMEAGNIDEAERAFRRVLELNPRAAAARLQLGRIQLARGEPARAIATAEDVAKERPQDLEAAILLTRSLRAQGDLPRAQRELDVRLARHPDVPGLHLEMGWVALGRRDVAAARTSFGQALRLMPELREARIGLASADLTEGKTADAERALRELVTADPSLLDAYDLLGRIYVSRGELDRALAEYDALAARAKRPAGALTMIGMIHEGRGNEADARKAYERALEADSGAGVAANNLAWMYAQEGKLDDALKLATTAQQRLRQRPEAEDTLGWVYYQKNLPGLAIPAFERAIARAPNHPVYHYHLGLAHLKAGNDRQGRAALQRALTLKADFPGADDARTRLSAPRVGG